MAHFDVLVVKDTLGRRPTPVRGIAEQDPPGLPEQDPPGLPELGVTSQ